MVNSSLDIFGGSSHENNTWTVSYNLTGDGEFAFEDLFLTGVDPLNVKEYGSTKALILDTTYNFVKSKLEIILLVSAVILGVVVLIL